MQQENLAQATYSFEEISTISSKGQTTIPKPVRQALGVGEGDQIAFHVDESGVTVRRAGENFRPNDYGLSIFPCEGS